ncbi:ATP-dependent nuclease [Streptomyces sp. 3214.6]|uniref:ATP-dependent nuclease n=1 Tax=Streptomyces sp. 3214.6 TaxID=1882757 RepID=UPI00090A5C21|nr:AAA family ATPase [Streptomyces sp. 3214.6]SHI19887.1 Predicted ATP-dependent endonuclease of the OLD family, contains P-loop ATPase and TOPRIM domains [Streptomyces sp. 3214.6]
MLDVEIRIKNYRCFGDEPSSFRVRDDFSAFIGTNNSGKSSLLRLLYEIRPLLNLLHSELTIYQNIFTDQQWSWSPTVLPGERINRAGVERPVELQFIVHDGPHGPFVDNGNKLILSTQFDRKGGRPPLELRTFSGDRLTALQNPTMENIQSFFRPLSGVMKTISDTMYIGPFRNAIHVGSNDNYYDIQTGNAFINAFNQFKTGPDPTANEAVHEMTEELRRIFGYEKLEINPSGNTLQLMIDGRSHRLSELGAGFAHFVVVMVNVLVRRPKLLLLDEPELNLHASLQLDFLQTLARYTEQGVLFATHSLGLARTAADHIYTVAKPTGGTSQIRPYEEDQDLVTLLGQLSFAHRPEMGFNKVLLVEGKTELRTLMQFLRLYGKEHDVLMLPLHGGDMIRGDVRQELTDLLRIGKEVHYLIDSERSAPGTSLDPERQAFVDLCQKINITGHVLDRRALENYFTDRAVRRAFGDSARSLAPFGKLAKTPGVKWRKTDNWRAASEMHKAEIDGTDLGTFLGSL